MRRYVPVSEAAAAVQRLAEMPALQSQYLAALELLNNRARESLVAYIGLGQLAKGVEVFGSLRPYGPRDKYIIMLARALGCPARIMRLGYEMLLRFDPGEIELFYTRKSAAGHMITPNHLRVIMPYNSEMRRWLIEFFYSDSPTNRQLFYEACRLIGPRRRVRESCTPTLEEYDAMLLQRIREARGADFEDLDDEEEDEEPDIVVARREIAEMPDLALEFRCAMQLFDDLFELEVRTWIALGRIALAVKTDPTLRDGRPRLRVSSAVKLVATALGMQASSFRAGLQLVETFSAEQLESFSTRRNVYGFVIQLSLLHTIMSVPAETVRNQALEFWYATGADLEDLTEEIDRLSASGEE